jgi:putative IMPACT (imprinted ancient) family translation regulator
MLGPARQVWRVSDDGEPSGTAGKPILGQINSYGLTNILIIVVRYFGGKLLGVSGLINAYRSAAGSAITNGEIIEKTIRDFYELRFPYTSMNDVMRIIKDEGVDQSDQRFDQTCMLMINFRHSSKERILKLLNRVDGLVSVYSHTA